MSLGGTLRKVFFVMEEYRNIKGYEDYQVSNLGNVKSFWFGNQRILKASKNHYYLAVTLRKEGKRKTFKVHQLVAMAFLNHEPCGMKLVVNHIDFNKTNNNVNNLEVITQRENTNKKHLNNTSKYVGVSWFKRDNKWRSTIKIDGKNKHLGLFKDKLQASKAYNTALGNVKILVQ